MTSEILTTTIRSLLQKIYSDKIEETFLLRIQNLLDEYKQRISVNSPPALNHADSFLITYADQFQNTNELPLKTLHRFCMDYLQGIITGVHILPFFPYTSDDGFSVSDYLQVNPALGDWNDIEQIAVDFSPYGGCSNQPLFPKAHLV